MTCLMKIVQGDGDLRQMLVDSLNKTNDITETAMQIGVDRSTVYNWINYYNIINNAVWKSHKKAKKTKKMIAFEGEYNVDIVEFIIHLLNKTDNLRFIENILGVDWNRFYEWRNRFEIERKVVWG